MKRGAKIRQYLGGNRVGAKPPWVMGPPGNMPGVKDGVIRRPPNKGNRRKGARLKAAL